MKNMKIYSIIIFVIGIAMLVSCQEKSPVSDVFPTDITENIDIPTSSENITEEKKEVENSSIYKSIEILEKFILIDTPKSNTWNKYRDSPTVTVTKKRDNTLSVVTGEFDHYSPIITFDMRQICEHGGYFIASNYGESAPSGLYFKTHYGNFQTIYEGYIGTIVGFYTLDENYDVIYYLGGDRGHLAGSESGYISRLIKENGDWEIDRYFGIPLKSHSDDLDEEVEDNTENENIPIPIDREEYSSHIGNFPNAFCLKNDIVYIITDTKLLMIKDNIATKLLENIHWRQLRPNSIVRIDDFLYIGMQGGVASYNLETEELFWYEKIED